MSNFGGESEQPQTQEDMICFERMQEGTPPEILLGLKSEKIDIWGAGLVFAELYTGKPLFHQIKKGQDERDFFKILCNVVGNPSKKSWPEGYQ